MKRHLKVVDTDTGEIVGYSRYILPEECKEMQWLEAQVGEPSTEEKVFEERWRSVTEEGRMRGLNYGHLEEFGPELERVEEGIMKEGGPYVCEYSLLIFLLPQSFMECRGACHLTYLSYLSC